MSYRKNLMPSDITPSEAHKATVVEVGMKIVYCKDCEKHNKGVGDLEELAKANDKSLALAYCNVFDSCLDCPIPVTGEDGCLMMADVDGWMQKEHDPGGEGVRE